LKVQNTFEVPIPPAEAWSFLMDIPATVPCFPGAELTEKIDDANYKGRVTVKLGPLTMVFNGKVEIRDRDDAARSGTMKASWSEAKGRGNANTVTRFSMQDSAGGTAIVLESDLQLAGQVAQYGRASGMIENISAQLIAKFADNLRARLNDTEPEHTTIDGLSIASRALLNRLKSYLENESWLAPG
jgi:carbon monoxide dehydrogenase subunit G